MEPEPSSTAADEPQPSTTYPLNILQMTRTAQQQNGLKHGDYGRYRCGQGLGAGAAAGIAAA